MRLRGRTTVLAAVGLIAVGLLGLCVWYWLDRRLAFDGRLQDRHTYPARLLERLATLPRELHESSGVAVSRTQPGILWSHNDSGDGPHLYAIDLSGRLRATVRVTNAEARDWEDIAGGPCPRSFRSQPDGTSCLYVGDIGDNNRARSELAVYVVAEPSLEETSGPPATIRARSFRFRYPGGPTDSEALAVQPDGDVTIVTKGWTGRVEFFRIAADNVARALDSGELLTAEPSDPVGIDRDQRIGPLVTGAAVSPDGMTLAVRTYTEVYFLRAAGAGDAGTRWQSLGRPCLLGAAEPLGEGIDFLDAETLVLTSERSGGRPGTLHRVRCDTMPPPSED
jgi:hypothetical protein